MGRGYLARLAIYPGVALCRGPPESFDKPSSSLEHVSAPQTIHTRTKTRQTRVLYPDGAVA